MPSSTEPAQGRARVNGAELYYEVAGRGTPVVLIHGFSLDRRVWDPQVDALAEAHRVIRYDVRGFGRSVPAEQAPFRHADDLRAFLDYLEVPRAHVVGLSMGGSIALHHALLYPDATAKLVLVDSALDGYAWSAEWVSAWQAIERLAKTNGVAAANAKWLACDLFAPAREDPACRARLEQIIGDYTGSHWIAASGAQSLRPPAAGRLSEVRAPTLVVVGERDLPDFREIAALLGGGIPHAQRALIPGAGHVSNMENAAAFNARLLEFLQAADDAQA